VHQQKNNKISINYLTVCKCNRDSDFNLNEFVKKNIQALLRGGVYLTQWSPLIVKQLKVALVSSAIIIKGLQIV